MKLYLDTAACLLSLSQGGSNTSVNVPAKAGVTLALEIFPSTELSMDATGVLTTKPKGNYSASPVARALSWTAPTTSGAGYLFALDLNTSDLLALFTGSLDTVVLMADITWVSNGETSKTQTFSISVGRPVSVGDEGSPSQLPDLKASQADAEAGTDNAKWMTPLRVAQAIATLSSGGGGGSASFILMNDSNLDSGWFTGVANEKPYAVDTTSGPAYCQLPASPAVGDTIEFADAKGTWNTHGFTIDRNGKKIEGLEVNYADTAQGTQFFIVYIDDTTGWKIYESGTKPHILVAPTAPSGTAQVGSLLTADNGTWTGSPTGYTYQWWNSVDGGTTKVNISGATASTYTLQSSDNGLVVGVDVTAANSNGSSLPASSAVSAVVTVPSYPSGAIAAWHLNDDGSGNVSSEDATGNGNALVNTGGVALGGGKFSGDAVWPDPNSGYTQALTCIGLTGFDPTQYTLSTWLKPSAVSDSGWSCPFQLGAYLTGRVLFILNPDGSVYFIDGFTNAYGSSSIGLTFGAWNHVAVVGDQSSVELYINGAFAGTFTGSFDCPPNFYLGTADDQFEEATAAYQFGGEIDETVLFSRKFSSGEVSDLYSGGAGLIYTT